MTELRIETLTMPAADLGPENPLPPLGSGKDIHHSVKAAPDIPEDMRRNMAYGRVANILPYTMQDGYTRQLRPRDFRVAVLENKALRATFLLELGGRLWSLIHKASGRELLEVNPVFQPANLALRNAWFSGGVEWNIGTTGHSPFTCSPLFAARVQGPDGTPALRMYEWERIRQVPFQIDAYLPDDASTLFVHIRIINPHEHPVPMYWWSNIAVPETSHTRVIIPADTAYSFGYGKAGLRYVPIPQIDGTDITYPTHLNRSADFFFHIPEDQQPWITALDDEGSGLIQTSTARLRGRKLFVWGMGPGGRTWQTFLSRPGHAYIEIQAGLARTQLEHLPMPANTEWSWLESYGLMRADPEAVHGSDWKGAVDAVAAKLKTLMPTATLKQERQRGADISRRPPDEVIQRGSGWGTLERIRREIAGAPPFCSEALIFDDDALTEAQVPWLTLLKEGSLPVTDPSHAPRSYIVQKAWRELLANTAAAPNTKSEQGDWQTWLHLGVMHYAAGDRLQALTAWQRSLEAQTTPWALRNLALMAWQDQCFDNAGTLYSLALQMAPDLLPLAVECGQKLIAMQQGQKWLDLLDEVLVPEVRSIGRIRLLEAQAALAVGDLDRVGRFFEGPLVIDDLREGERSLSHLWFEYQAQRISEKEGIAVDETLRARVRREFPVPKGADFRMST